MQRLLIIFTALLCFLSFSATGQTVSASIEGVSVQAHNGELDDCSRGMPDDHGDVLWSETRLNAARAYSSLTPQAVTRISLLRPVLHDIRGPPAP